MLHAMHLIDLCMQMDMDPTVNINWGAPVNLPRYTLQTFFDTQSEHLKETLGIENEEEWQVSLSAHPALTG